MKNPAQIATSLSHPAVVGTVHSTPCLKAAMKVRREECDWIELRADNFFPNLDPLRKWAGMLPAPRILTVRHASEGGEAMTARERRTVYGELMETARLVDIELRWAGAMAEVIRQAGSAGVGLILSHHDFQKTPSRGNLRELARRARDAGADVFKVATMTQTARDLATLIEFLEDEKGKMPLAAMGMGLFGKISRLALAQAGSCLNYGYLGRPNASGQWPAKALKRWIADVTTPPGQAAGPSC
jgi:3-dehydroquinate dehydratase-1